MLTNGERAQIELLLTEANGHVTIETKLLRNALVALDAAEYKSLRLEQGARFAADLLEEIRDEMFPVNLRE